MAAEQNDQDVDMKSMDEESDDVSRDAAGAEGLSGDTVTLKDIRENVSQLEKGVVSKNPIMTKRVLRQLTETRGKLNTSVVRGLINGFYTHSEAERAALLRCLGEAANDQDDARPTKLRASRFAKNPLLPEVDAYLHLLIVLHLLDSDKPKESAQCSDLLMEKLMNLDRRTLDSIAAKCYFYHSRCYEMIEKLASIRGFLHRRLRTATLKNDYEGQAVLLNCLLRNFLSYSLYDQADKLVTKCSFPEQVSNNEWARYLYYVGRIKAIQLEYSEAQKFLQQAMRKAPQQTGIGFRQAVQKLLTTVELLLGEIPERQLFRHQHMRKSLGPYFKLTLAVRAGDVRGFDDVVKNHTEKFQNDGTYTLIQRLHRNVIKTAVRMIATAYSRIPLVDVAEKLALDSPEDAEFIVAKAIKDNVIDATIDHEKGFVQTKTLPDLYCTKEPQGAFHNRISFCLDVRNQAVKALRFPATSYQKDLDESAAERRLRENLDLEHAAELGDDDDDELDF